MLNIYTNKKIPKGYRLIYDVELEFKCIDCSTIENDEAIKNILRAVYDIRVSHGFPIISDSPSIYDCSTGFKAAIVAYYYRNRKDVLVNIAECGVNVIELLVKLDLDLNLYNSNYVPLGFSDGKVILNGEEVTLCEATGRFIYERY